MLSNADAAWFGDESPWCCAPVCAVGSTLFGRKRLFGPGAPEPLSCLAVLAHPSRRVAGCFHSRVAGCLHSGVQAPGPCCAHSKVVRGALALGGERRSRASNGCYALAGFSPGNWCAQRAHQGASITVGCASTRLRSRLAGLEGCLCAAHNMQGSPFSLRSVLRRGSLRPPPRPTGTPVCKHPRWLRFQRARLSLRRASVAPCGRHRVLTRLRCAQARVASPPFDRPSLVLTSKVMSTERFKTIINSQPLVRKYCGKLNSVLHYEPYNLRNCCLTNNALTSSEGNSVTLFIANTGATRPRISAL